MSVLLLIERSKVGRGPKIPLRNSYSRATVEGLAAFGEVVLLLDGFAISTIRENGTVELSERLEKGDTVCAELCGAGCVTVQLEE